MTIRKYGGRYWALYDDAGELVCYAYTRRGLPRSSGGYSSFPLLQRHPFTTRHKPRTR